ncbi:hypothetical protein [Foetidibacter luteolus]|uniref:hypothetical protein n=1 Tax=Foetidibacter luteolus TaxID=2608880 RepID=UPI00129B6655|nr:hypothetical protein [Foetidibacter luteolus]
MKRIFVIILLLAVAASSVNAQGRKKRTRAKQQKARTTAPAKKRQAAPKADEDKTDTLLPKNVIITSTFKPVLKNASKINFNGTALAPDNERPQLAYNIPSQNLFFAYQPATLQPMAANIDSSIQWENKSFVKAGYGNYTSPYFEAGLSLGDGTNSVVNVHAKHTSSKGSLPFQTVSRTGADVTGVFHNKDNTQEWAGKVFFDNSVQYQYGFQPDSLKDIYTKDSLRQRFTLLGMTLGLRNKTQNMYGLNYNPNIYMDFFRDNRGASEQNFVLNTPLEKSIGKIFALALGFTADFTTYKRDTADRINNNLFYLTPAVHFKTPNFNLVAGFTPSWDNKTFHWLPNFSADVKLKEEKFIFQAGWVGYFNKTNYRNLAQMNPWLQQPTFLNNTKITEMYAGFKGSAGSHVTYNARVSYLQFTNQPLFVNDTLTGKSFEVVNEPEMKAIRLHGELGYTLQENFSLLAGATFTQYSNLKVNEKAFGLLPIEINGALRWRVMKDILVKGDVFFWDGPRYRNKQLQAGKLDPAFDLNGGVEVAVLPKLNVWLQFNNIFNNKYYRWNQYQMLGFNVLAGVVYSFGQPAAK